jgi:hypothetical protein
MVDTYLENLEAKLGEEIVAQMDIHAEMFAAESGGGYDELPELKRLFYRIADDARRYEKSRVLDIITELLKIADKADPMYGQAVVAVLSQVYKMIEG